MDEKKLIRDVKAGNESAFKALVESYKDMVVNTCYGFLQNQENAEDTAQEVFVEVYQSIHRFREEAKFSTWVYRIAVNKSLNLKKKNSRRQWSLSFQSEVDGGDESVQIADEKTLDPHADLEQQERVKILHSAIETLAKNQKIAFTLSKYENLSYKEISEVMGTSISSVESLLNRAKKNLQKKLHNYYKE